MAKIIARKRRRVKARVRARGVRVRKISIIIKITLLRINKKIYLK